jgi:hypothetical protein
MTAKRELLARSRKAVGLRQEALASTLDATARPVSAGNAARRSRCHDRSGALGSAGVRVAHPALHLLMTPVRA